MRTPNRDILMGKWKQFKGQVRKEWGKLRNDRMDQIGGSYQRLVGVVQERYGHIRQSTRHQADRLTSHKPGNNMQHR